MFNPRILHKRFFSKSGLWSLSLLLGLGMTLGLASLARADKSDTAPVELKTLINEIQAAADRRDVKAVMSFYSPEFTNSDGLNFERTKKALTNLWGRYSSIKYNTTIQSWERSGNKLVAETVTEIEGTTNKVGRDMNMKASIRSRQTFVANKLVSQDILSERIQLFSGKTPPKIEVRLPERVKVGQQFDFDVIVLDPIGDNLLAGTAIDEKVDLERYLNPKTIDLELLPAGGVFKRVKAATTPEKRWLSALLIQGDGMVLVTQRVLVEK
ncbi:MAG: hypothetical protein N5P05_000056 [Chroococcopsis gigantea SAG 12.99]|jgi:ketosteroid isomerase-like protein|nr:nuclear transport factor 2 family protein [Chlorogloea purpurea SAG 13.99]MDV2998450.1 hypothetical protein [Chroococcopsis gigantea SAG 12.99]